MKPIYRLFLFGALMLILATAACAPTNLTPFPTPPGFQTLVPEGNAPTGTPIGPETAVTETVSVTETASPTETVVVSPTSGTLTPGIPVTGLNIALLDCPFCVNERAYTMLLMPDTSTFKVVSSTTSNPPTCTTIDVTNGKQVVMCAGPKKSLFTLNVCTNTGGCADYPVALIDCIVPSAPNTEPTTTVPRRTPTPGSTATPIPLTTSTPTDLPTATTVVIDTATPTP